VANIKLQMMVAHVLIIWQCQTLRKGLLWQWSYGS